MKCVWKRARNNKVNEIVFESNIYIHLNSKAVAKTKDLPVETEKMSKWSNGGR